jgi:hypothetical protein
VSRWAIWASALLLIIPALALSVAQTRPSAINNIEHPPAAQALGGGSAGSAVFAFGGAPQLGSLTNQTLNESIVGIAATSDGNGYWLVAADGGVFAFGDAPFEGSLGSDSLNESIVGMAANPHGSGYWLVAADGGVFAFGGAPFEGSLGSDSLNESIVGIAATSDGNGYWLVAADGGVFAFGDAPFEGSLASQQLAQPVASMASAPKGGYWLVEGQRVASPFTPALVADLDQRVGMVTAAVEDLNSGQVYVYRPGLALNTASIVKVQFLGTLLAEAQDQNRALTPDDAGLVAPMIEVSDNDAATAVLMSAGGPGAVSAFDQSIGMTDSVPIASWGDSTTTATDQLVLLDHFVRPNAVLTDESRAYGLSLLDQVEPSQVFGISYGVAPGSVRAVKTGRVPSEGVINGIAWIDGQGRNYLIAILTQGVPSDDDGLQIMNEISASAWATLGR